MSPVRVQRKRTKGWRMPPNTVYVGRPSKWGNPWEVGKVMFATGKRAGELINAKDAVELFRNTADKAMKSHPELAADIRGLRGKNLACWCKLSDPCHADVLLELANQP